MSTKERHGTHARSRGEQTSTLDRKHWQCRVGSLVTEPSSETVTHHHQKQDPLEEGIRSYYMHMCGCVLQIYTHLFTWFYCMLKNVLYIFASIPSLSLRTWDSLQFRNIEAKAKRLMNSSVVGLGRERPGFEASSPSQAFLQQTASESDVWQYRRHTLHPFPFSGCVNEMDANCSFLL